MKSKLLVAATLAAMAMAANAQGAAPQRLHPPIANKEWETPFPGFKIVANLYYVGTYDLGCYLIDTGQGLILINSGADGSYPLIKANIEKLGFKTSDIKIITSTHGHWDHVGDLAAFQKDAPGAKTYMSERDAPVLESGGNVDYRRAEGRGIIYDPVKVDVRTKPGDHIKLGNTDLTVHQAYGHTPGATSFTYAAQEGGKTYNVLIVNMDGINAGVKLLGSPGYPTIVQDFASTLEGTGDLYARHLGVLACGPVQSAQGLQARRSVQSGALRRSRRLQGQDRRLPESLSKRSYPTKRKQTTLDALGQKKGAPPPK